jgi:hypothetical protein
MICRDDGRIFQRPEPWSNPLGPARLAVSAASSELAAVTCFFGVQHQTGVATGIKMQRYICVKLNSAAEVSLGASDR